MDNNRLEELLNDGRERQFWLKPVGPPQDHPDWGVECDRRWIENQIEIHFHKNPVRIAVGAVLIAYRVRYSTLIFVAQRLPVSEWSHEEVRSEYWRDRFPHHIKARNLTPEFGMAWKRFDIRPFPLAKAGNELHPEDPACLGAIQRGCDRATIPRWFAESLIRRIRDSA